MNDNQSPVLNFSKIGRRKGVARLCKQYPTILAGAMSQCTIQKLPAIGDDRSLTMQEFTKAVTRTAAQFMAMMLNYRSLIENDARPGSLCSFVLDATTRIRAYSDEHFQNARIIIPVEYRNALAAVESEYITRICTGLQVEICSADPPDEAEFWADVFRGIADTDSSGALSRAAGLVLLDHLPAFQMALKFHMPEFA